MSHKLTGNEKAFLGGLLAFLSTSVIQLQAQTGGYSLRDFAWSLGAWVVVHLGVFLTTNTLTPPVPPTPTPAPPVVPPSVPSV